MKKFTILYMAIIGGFLLGGCSNKIEQTIGFENYHLTLTTNNQYEETIADKTNGVPVIKQYIQKAETGFVGSIIITKNTIQTGTDIEAFTQTNSSMLSQKIPGIESTSTKEFSFDCESGSKKVELESFTIEQGNETYYLNQSFFIASGYIYGLSTISTNKKESKNLVNSLKTINCKGYQQ